jgi:CheY-like chemotaxis protein
MPEMDGLEATEKIRLLPDESSKKLPIIAMTANVFKEDIKKCLRAGMDDHVGKPFDLAIIMEKLNQYL